MRQMRLHYPIPLISRILKVSASGFMLGWIGHPLSERRRKYGWRWRLRQHTGEPDRPMGQRDCSMSWPSME